MIENILLDTGLVSDIINGRVEPFIYAFSTQTIPNYLKVGDTYRPVETRLNEWRKYFPSLEKQFIGVAKVGEETFFRDYSVHQFLEEIGRIRLERNTFPDMSYFSKEFFEAATVEDIKKAIEDIKFNFEQNNSKYQMYKFDESRVPVTHIYSRSQSFEPRPNQQVTIDKFQKAIDNGRINLLMYAVMRFGKSFTSLCCAVAIKAKIVVVVSAKADVKEEWKKTTESHTKFEGYEFIDSDILIRDDQAITQKLTENKKLVIFLTLQDLQGSQIKQKHKEIFENQIDLLIIDETHFGARASEYGKVLQDNGLKPAEIKKELKLSDNSIDQVDESIKIFNSKVKLHLSGTPYRILMGSEFTEQDIIGFYQFTDIADDQARWNEENLYKDEVKEWDNPYYGFPQMIRFAFNPNQSSIDKMEAMKKDGITYTFSALFKPKSIVKDKSNQLHKEFEHTQEILELLEVIDGSKNDNNLLGFLDFDKIKQGKMCRHIVCVLPYRASCDSLEKLILDNKAKFKNLNEYQIINISGVENENLYKDTQAVKTKIKDCEKQNQKTLTLTVNRMLTGSTVQEWDTMLYFKDTASPQEYDQAVFRLQNPYIKEYKDQSGDTIKYNMKPQTLLVDFDPNRMFRMQEQKAQIYNVNTKTNGNQELEQRIQKELQISPIIRINQNKLVQVQPSDILNAVREYSSQKSVLDEALDIPIDFSLLDIDTIRKEIEKQAEIGTKQGLKIKANQGEGDELEAPEIGSNEPVETQNTTNQSESKNLPKDEEISKLKKQFATYYSRILFFAFLTSHLIKSVNEIIELVNKDTNSQRIAKNLDLDTTILQLFAKHINPFILSEIEYKIQNINTLANDPKLQPIERAGIAMKKFSRLSSSEIVTPSNVVDQMLDVFPDGSLNKDESMLDIASKQGEFVYGVYQKFGKDVAQNFYSIPTSKIAFEFTRKVYELLELDLDHIEQNYNSYDLIKPENQLIKDKQIKFNDQFMKFNSIVGNPPYQEDDGGAGASARPIYNNFVNIAKEIEPEYFSMIMPTRWFAGGKDLDEFRDQMLNDIHISQLHDFLNPEQVFPGTNNRGGICYFLWEKEYNKTSELTKVFTYKNSSIPQISTRNLKTDNSDIFIRHSLGIDVINKTNLHEDFKSFEKFVSARKPFGLEANIIQELEIFRNSKNGLNHSIKCFGKGKKVGYLEKNEILKGKELIEKYKVYTPRANNIGTELNDDNLNTFIGEPNTICTESYIVLGVGIDLDKNSSKNLCKYFTTKFVRFLHSLAKASHDATSKTYLFVPLQDFTNKSDIDWSKSVAEINQQLYVKYTLTTEEIEFVESMIKEMK